MMCLVKGGIPGGENLKNCKPLENMVKKQDTDGRLNAAICCSPALALGTWGLLEGKKVCIQLLVSKSFYFFVWSLYLVSESHVCHL